MRNIQIFFQCLWLPGIRLEFISVCYCNGIYQVHILLVSFLPSYSCHSKLHKIKWIGFILHKISMCRSADLHTGWAGLTINSIFIAVVSTTALIYYTSVATFIFILSSLLMRYLCGSRTSLVCAPEEWSKLTCSDHSIAIAIFLPVACGLFTARSSVCTWFCRL